MTFDKDKIIKDAREEVFLLERQRRDRKSIQILLNLEKVVGEKITGWTDTSDGDIIWGGYQFSLVDYYGNTSPHDYSSYSLCIIYNQKHYGSAVWGFCAIDSKVGLAAAIQNIDKAKAIFEAEEKEREDKKKGKEVLDAYHQHCEAQRKHNDRPHIEQRSLWKQFLDLF